MIRLTSETTERIRDEADLRDKFIFSDLIAAQFPDGARRTLWTRPLSEFTGPGPYKVQAVVVNVASKAEFKRLRKYVHRLKYGD